MILTAEFAKQIKRSFSSPAWIFLNFTSIPRFVSTTTAAATEIQCESLSIHTLNVRTVLQASRIFHVVETTSLARFGSIVYANYEAAPQDG
jgi:hypothetical protein